MGKAFIVLLVCAGIIIGGMIYIMRMTRPTSASGLLPFQMPESPVFYSKELKSLEIPKLNVATRVDRGTKQEDGRYSFPELSGSVSELSRGQLLGERGSVVVAGLSSLPNGRGVFADLRNLAPGDEIIAKDTSDETYTYVVEEVGVHSWDPESRMKVFGRAEDSYLTLLDYGYSYDDRGYVLPAPVVYAVYQQ